MTNVSTGYRLGAASGLIFVMLFVAAIAVSSFPPDSDAGILRYYHDPAVKTWSLVHFFLVTFGCFFLLWFVSTMRTSVVTTEPGIEAFAHLAFVGGVATAVMFLVTSAVSTGIVAATIRFSSFQLDPNTARLVGGVGYLVFKSASMTAAIWVGPASVIAFRTRTSPIWVGWLGLAVALGLLLAWLIDLGYLLLFVWVAISSALMIHNGPQHVDHKVVAP